MRLFIPVLTCRVHRTRYVFTIVAANAEGDSEPVVCKPVTPKTLQAPEEPTQVSAKAGSTEATVSWQPPMYNGGSPVTGYLITADGGKISKEVVATCAYCAHCVCCLRRHRTVSHF